jgi:hypothetical protein
MEHHDVTYAVEDDGRGERETSVAVPNVKKGSLACFDDQRSLSLHKDKGVDPRCVSK